MLYYGRTNSLTISEWPLSYSFEVKLYWQKPVPKRKDGFQTPNIWPKEPCLWSTFLDYNEHGPIVWNTSKTLQFFKEEKKKKKKRNQGVHFQQNWEIVRHTVFRLGQSNQADMGKERSPYYINSTHPVYKTTGTGGQAAEHSCLAFCFHSPRKDCGSLLNWLWLLILESGTTAQGNWHICQI